MAAFLTRQRQSGWLSILPQSGRVVLAHIVREREGRPSVRMLDNFAAENGVVDALERLRTARKLNTYACTTLLADGECSVTQLEAPPVPREERKEALRWSLKEMVNYPVETACLDVLDIPAEGLPQGRAAGVLVVSAAESTVRACAAPFEAAEVDLAAIDIPELAQRNIAALLEDENRGLVFLRIDESGMMLTLTFRGELVAVRRSDMISAQLGSRDDEQRGRVMERLLLEMQRSLDNFDRQYSHIPVSKVVVASYPHAEHLVEELRHGTYVPVVAMDLSAQVDFPGAPELKSPEMQSRYLLALGAALRTGAPA